MPTLSRRGGGGRVAERIVFPDGKGGHLEGVLALPSASKGPGVVLLQEWWGVNAHIESLVDRLAAAGFVAIAPDLYHGYVAKNAEDAGAAMQRLSFAAAVDEVGAAASFLRAHPRGNGRVGVTGFCMGGALSFYSAAHLAKLDAVVPFYGVPDPSKVDYAKVTAPIQAHFANRDAWAAPAKAEAVKAALRGPGQSMELWVYDADHAFVNDTRPEVYSPENAKLAWDRMVAFFQAHLAAE